MKKEATATLLGNRIFINVRKETQSVTVFSNPLFELTVSDNPEMIGEKIKICIESFLHGNERLGREDFKTINEPLIKLSGEKSSKAFWTKVKYVPISLVDNKLIFYPTSNKGWKEGFKNTGHPNIEVEYNKMTLREMGAALLKALDLSDIELIKSK